MSETTGASTRPKADAVRSVTNAKRHPRDPACCGPDDISKRMFIEVLDRALSRAGSLSALGRVIGTDHRNIAYWKAGRMPVYADMQKWFYILIEAGKDKGVK